MQRWLTVVTIGFALVVVAMLFVALVLIDKKHFGGLVGSAFLATITSGVIVGGLAMLIGALAMPARKTPRGIILILWALIAVTSPLFGFLFLGPWAVLVLASPAVIWALVTLRQAPQPS
jgi:hypothetical protein